VERAFPRLIRDWMDEALVHRRRDLFQRAEQLHADTKKHRLLVVNNKRNFCEYILGTYKS
jgi:hypothetical protein